MSDDKELCGIELHLHELNLKCDRDKDHPGWHNDMADTQVFWNHTVEK